jgi:hypothetical protein
MGFSRKPYIREKYFRWSFTDFEGIVIYSELKWFLQRRKKVPCGKKDDNSENSNGISHAMRPPIKSVGEKCT